MTGPVPGTELPPRGLPGWWFSLPGPVRSVGLVAAGDSTSKLIAFVGTALIVRLATPEQMATITLFVTLQTILLQVTDLGLGVSLVKHLAGIPPEGGGQARLLRTVLTSRALLIAAFGLPALLAGPWVAVHVFHRPLFVEPLRFAALATVGGGLLAFVTSYLQARRRFLALSLVRIGDGGGRFLLLIGLLVLWGFSVPGVLWIQVLVPLLLGMMGLLLAPRGLLARAGSVTEVRTLFDVSRWILLATLANMLAFQLDSLLLGVLSSREQLGAYGASLRLSSPLQLLAGALGTVLFTEALQRRQPHQARRFFLRTLRLTVPLGLLGFLGALVASPWLVRVFPQYAGLRPLFLLSSAGLAAYAATAGGQGVVLALGRADLVAAVAVGQLAVTGAGNLLLVPGLGALGAALTTGTAWVLSAAVYVGLVLWLTRPRPGGHVMDRTPPPH